MVWESRSYPRGVFRFRTIEEARAARAKIGARRQVQKIGSRHHPFRHHPFRPGNGPNWVTAAPIRNARPAGEMGWSRNKKLVIPCARISTPTWRIQITASGVTLAPLLSKNGIGRAMAAIPTRVAMPERTTFKTLKFMVPNRAAGSPRPQLPDQVSEAWAWTCSVGSSMRRGGQCEIPRP